MDEQDIYILNALDKEVHAVAFGNHFHLKPSQIKRFRKEIGAFLDSNKGYLGLIAVSEKFDDPMYKETEEGKAELADRREEGIKRRCTYLQGIVNNLQVSLRRDLDTSNITAKVEAFATEGEILAMDELLAYQRKQDDKAKQKAEHARITMQRLASAQNAAVNQVKKDE